MLIQKTYHSVSHKEVVAILFESALIIAELVSFLFRDFFQSTVGNAFGFGGDKFGLISKALVCLLAYLQKDIINCHNNNDTNSFYERM